MSSDFSVGQMNQLANSLSKAGWSPRQVAMLGQAMSWKFDAIERILDEKTLEGVIRSLITMRVERPGNDTSHLRFIESVIVGPTLGSATLYRSKDIFIKHPDPSFGWYVNTDQLGENTETQTALVYEMSRGGTFSELFGSFGVDPLELVWQQGQILEVCRHAHLFNQTTVTFFLFKVEGTLVVASVFSRENSLTPSIHEFSKIDYWQNLSHLPYRLVIPQQTF